MDQLSSGSVPRSVQRGDLLLVVLVLFSWSTGWIGLHYQLGVVAPEVSLLWRYLLAGALMTVLCRIQGARLLGFNRTQHVRFMLLGLLLFSLNFLLFYYAGMTLVSGLLSVIFALAAPGNMLVQAFGLRQKVSAHAALGAVIGVLGVGTLFWPQLSNGGSFHGASLVAIAMSLAATACFCLGNLISSQLSAEDVPALSGAAWGMVYGSAFLAVLALVRGLPFIIELTPVYLGSLVYLALVPSVIAFASYLTLLKRIGPANAGYLTVLFPVFALVISSAYEGYQWTLWSLAGIALVAIGNILVLRKPASAR